MKKILFIGPVSPPVSGPGIKNMEIIKWIENSKYKNEFSFYNTYGFKQKNFYKIYLFFKGLVKHPYIILSVSKNGRFFLIPLCFLLNKKVILLPAGGKFDLEIKKLPFLFKKTFLRVSKCIRLIFVESNLLASGLEELGFTNIKQFANPRADSGFKVKYETKGDFRIIFLSKIRERKGVLLLIKAVDRMVENGNRSLILNFFGRIEEDFKVAFEEAIRNKSYISYKGEVANDAVQKIISQHDVFVLPTTYKGEGLPGAVVEAAFTGIPIIVSDFRAVHEFIEHDKSGIIIPMGDTLALSNAILELSNNLIKRRLIGENIMSFSCKFNIDFLMKNFMSELIQIGWLQK